jgi:hypothetical protein
MGLWIGLVISLTLNNIALYFISSSPSNLPLIIIIPILGIGFGFLTLFIKKTFIVFASCTYLIYISINWIVFMLKSIKLVLR